MLAEHHYAKVNTVCVEYVEKGLLRISPGGKRKSETHKTLFSDQLFIFSAFFYRVWNFFKFWKAEFEAESHFPPVFPNVFHFPPSGKRLVWTDPYKNDSSSCIHLLVKKLKKFNPHPGNQNNNSIESFSKRTSHGNVDI